MIEELREQLAFKRKALHHAEMRVARRGISADPSEIIERDDLLAEVRSLEARLGIERTPTPQEIRRQYVPPPRYEAPVESESTFQQRMVGQQLNDRRAEIEHQTRLLTIHRRNLGHYRAQMRELGTYAPPYVRNGMGEQVQLIAQIKQTLRDLGQQVGDLPGDE